MNKFQEAENLRKKYRATLQRVTKQDVKALFDELFEKYPNFRAIGWKQYVPSFNDGAPCEFTMDTDFQFVFNDPEKINGSLTDEEVMNLFIREFGWPKLDPEVEKDITDVFNLISDDISETVFGSDVQIVITRSKIFTNSYSCG